MKGFNRFTFDPVLLRAECDKLKALLQKGSGLELEEDRDLSPVFKGSPNLVSIIGAAFGGVSNPDLIAQEYWVLDKLRCDFAMCNSRRQRFCFVEIEDASKNSIFTERKPNVFNGLMGRPPYYDWARRFEHGYSQILDWVRVLEDAKNTYDFRAHFGSSNRFDVEFVLVIGRDEFLDADMLERLAWRSKNVQVAGHKIKCITYDQLLDEAVFQLDLYDLQPAPATTAV